MRELNGEDAIVIRRMTYLTLSSEHRVIDGVTDIGFLRRARELIEEANRPFATTNTPCAPGPIRCCASYWSELQNVLSRSSGSSQNRSRPAARQAAAPRIRHTGSRIGQRWTTRAVYRCSLDRTGREHLGQSRTHCGCR